MPPRTTDPTTLSLTDLAAAYRSGDLRPTEATEAFLERLEPGPVYRVVTAERARRQARRAERLLDRGVDLGPLQGVPLAVKDLIDQEGEVTAAGSRALESGARAERDAPVAARLDAAGAVFLGRTTMTELAFSGLGLNPHHGTPPNAADAARIPGGSSSGSAVAVATGRATAALGSDTGGSVRIPASFNGLVGLKTTNGLLPTDGCTPLSTTLDTIGPIARTVEDAWQLFLALAARPAAPLPQAPERPVLLAADTVLQEELEPPVAAVLEDVLAAVERAGAEVRTGPLPALAAPAALQRRYGGFAAHEALALHEELLGEGSLVDPRVARRILAARGRSSSDYLRLHYAREAMRRAFWQEHRHVDAIVGPTVAILPPRTADLEGDDEAYLEANRLALKNTMVFNFLGGPAVSVPAGRTPEGLPVGVMIATAPGREDLALALGKRLLEAVAD